ncbi:hypothetical protein EJD97_019773 [Solanum chilense]|uniref:Uncharacterized protein n=1 Tax=Solanum chilense TaxID=4083 RepID=A0A6N2B124_SOLCI|nr:hypothetical protein EJD97_019773 [Solanum chilense]
MSIPKISNDTDLLHLPTEIKKQKHKVMQSPYLTFLNVKCQGCFQIITTIFSHSQNPSYMPHLPTNAMQTNWCPQKNY